MIQQVYARAPILGNWRGYDGGGAGGVGKFDDGAGRGFFAAEIGHADGGAKSRGEGGASRVADFFAFRK
jgi:hypothetical protein